MFRATAAGDGVTTGFDGETGAGEVGGGVGAVGVEVCDADRGGATGAASGAVTAGGVCVGGGVAADATGGGAAATGATGRFAARAGGAGRGGSGGAKNAMRSDSPTNPIAAAAPPYTISILIERPRLRGRCCRA